VQNFYYTYKKDINKKISEDFYRFDAGPVFWGRLTNPGRDRAYSVHRMSV